MLIHGASGSVGIATIQLAKTHGLKIIGTAGTKEGMDLVREQGCDFVYNHKEKDYMEQVKHDNPEGIDIILEMLANVNLNNDLQILKFKKGRVVVSLFKIYLFVVCIWCIYSKKNKQQSIVLNSCIFINTRIF